MRRFKNILAIYNNDIGDEGTLRRAAALARRNAAALTVARVLDDSEWLGSNPAVDADWRERRLEQQRSNLERVVDSVRQTGVEVRARVLTGVPFLEITREVVRQGHDLVMLTAEGRRGFRTMLFGSTSMHLMRKCPCPVWVMKNQPRSYAGILAAVDPSESGDEKDRLNRTLLELAISLARSEGGKLHLVHAWELSGPDRDTSRSEITPEMLDELMARNLTTQRRRIDTLLSRHDLEGLDYEIHLPEGPPEWVIPDLAARKAIELIVMGTVCRTGIPGFLIGNTAETVLQQVDCAVLTVKPEGFETPVVDAEGQPLQRPAMPLKRAASG